MKKFIMISMFSLIGIIMVACNDEITTSTITTDLSTESLNSQTEEETTEEITTEIQTTELPTTTETPTTESSLVSEELLIHSSWYGNTNGNANNLGLAVYDNLNQLHYYALGSSVYSYDAFTDETELLFTITDGGLIQNLTLSEEYLYFVTTEYMYAYSYDFSDGLIDTIYEGEVYYMSRYFDYIYLDMLNTTYEQRGLHVYKADDQAFYTQYSWGARTVNVSGTKLYFSYEEDPKIKLSAGNLMGRTNLADLESEGIVEIVELNLFKDDGINRSFGMIARTETELNLYYYSTDTGLELIYQSSGESLHSLNNDGNNIYFIGAGDIHQYNVETQESSILVELENDGHYINIINHWIYYSNIERTNLYRIHPDTLEVINLHDNE